MYDELIKALRETDFGYVCEHCEHEDMCRNNDCVIIQASDALEAAEKRIAVLEADKKTLINVVKDKSDFHATKDAMRIAELESLAIHLLKQLPKEGEWIWENYCWHCSVCGENPTRGMGYVQGKDELFRACPNCGAKMKGANDADN